MPRRAWQGPRQALYGRPRASSRALLFVLPNGILNPRGQNTLAIALITNNAGGGSTGGGLGAVSLVDLGTVAGGAPLSLVASPGYAAP